MDKENMRKKIMENIDAKKIQGGVGRGHSHGSELISERPSPSPSQVKQRVRRDSRQRRRFRKPSQHSPLPVKGDFALIANKRGFPILDFVISCNSCGAEEWSPCIPTGICSERKFEWIARANSNRDKYKLLQQNSQRWLRESKPDWKPAWERTGVVA